MTAAAESKDPLMVKAVGTCAQRDMREKNEVIPEIPASFQDYDSLNATTTHQTCYRHCPIQDRECSVCQEHLDVFYQELGVDAVDRHLKRSLNYVKIL